MHAAGDQLSSAWPALPPPRGIELTVLPEQACSYLPDRMARTRAFVCGHLDPLVYHELMDAGFRRSGSFVYQPICAVCRECRAIRVPVEKFTPSKSQRRAWRRNQDVVVTIDRPQATREKFDLYCAYLKLRHDAAEEADADSFVSFLYDSPVNTLEFTYRDGAGKLLGVGICDVCARSLSSVYFYFDPAEESRALGTFSALREIDFARDKKIPHYYLGYWIEGCGSMRYKSSFEPNELLGGDGVWRDFARATPG